jgi:hypothetical protein
VSIDESKGGVGIEVDSRASKRSRRRYPGSRVLLVVDIGLGQMADERACRICWNIWDNGVSN